MTKVEIDEMYEGWLVRGTLHVEEAKTLVMSTWPDARIDSVSPARYRKVPNRQWGGWRLYQGTGRGTFDGVAVYGNSAACVTARYEARNVGLRAKLGWDLDVEAAR